MAVVACSQGESYYEKYRSHNQTRHVQLRQSCLGKAGYPSMTAYDVKGRSKQSEIIETVSGKTIRADVLPKTQVEIVSKTRMSKKSRT